MEQSIKQAHWANDRDRLLAENNGNRSKCMIFTGVMGYHRPVESFNIGKVGEHMERVLFEESGKKTSPT